VIVYWVHTRLDPPLPPEHPEFFGAFYKLSERFHWDVGPCWRDGITQLLHILDGSTFMLQTVRSISFEKGALLGWGLGTAQVTQVNCSRQCFCTPQLSSVGDCVPTGAASSCFPLIGLEPGVVFCCSCPCVTRIDELCVPRWRSADHCCTGPLLVCFWSACLLARILTFSFDLSHQLTVFATGLPLTGCVFAPFSVNPRHCWAWKAQEGSHFRDTESSAPYRWSYHAQSHLGDSFGPF
jgi:hypothetical protein